MEWRWRDEIDANNREEITEGKPRDLNAAEYEEVSWDYTIEQVGDTSFGLEVFWSDKWLGRRKLRDGVPRKP